MRRAKGRDRMNATMPTRILIVEDEALVAAMLEDMLTDFGAEVVGPAFTLDRACELARTADCDGAVLDVSIRGQSVRPVAEVLAARGIPFILATGYGGSVSQEWPGAAVVEKPYLGADIARALAAAGLTGPGQR
jgi:CheY-like chemotaxis protein